MGQHTEVAREVSLKQVELAEKLYEDSKALKMLSANSEDFLTVVRSMENSVMGLGRTHRNWNEKDNTINAIFSGLSDKAVVKRYGLTSEEESIESLFLHFTEAHIENFIIDSMWRYTRFEARLLDLMDSLDVTPDAED